MSLSARKCSYHGCTNRRSMKELTFFHFPLNPERRSLWIANCKNDRFQAYTNKQINGFCVCKMHFAPACFNNILQNSITRLATPTLDYIAPTKEINRIEGNNNNSKNSSDRSVQDLCTSNLSAAQRASNLFAVQSASNLSAVKSASNLSAVKSASNLSAVKSASNQMNANETAQSILIHHSYCRKVEEPESNDSLMQVDKHRLIAKEKELTMNNSRKVEELQSEYLLMEVNKYKVIAKEKELAMNNLRKVEELERKSLLVEVNKYKVVAKGMELRIKKLTEKLNEVRKDSRRKGMQINYWKSAHQKALHRQLKEKEITEGARKYLSEAAQTLFEMQLIHRHGQTWSREEKKLALSIHSKSPYLYQSLRETYKFVLPSKSTIENWTKELYNAENSTDPFPQLTF